MDLQISEITPGFGARIEGWTPARDLDTTEVGRLRELFDEYQVLVFRDVEVAPDEQRYLCGLLIGERPPAERTIAESNTHLYSTRISNKDEDGNAPYGRLLFHSDGMWSESPQELLSLYGERVEPPSVPTVFVSAVGAWERLGDELLSRLSGQSAIHATGQRSRGDEAGELLQPQRTTERSRSTPLPVIHPRTARPILYVSQMMTTEIEGLELDESEALLDELFEVLYDPAFSFSHDWLENDLVVWDNLAVQHGRPTVSQAGPERSLRKVSAPRPSADLQASVERPTFSRS